MPKVLEVAGRCLGSSTRSPGTLEASPGPEVGGRQQSGGGGWGGGLGAGDMSVASASPGLLGTLASAGLLVPPQRKTPATIRVAATKGRSLSKAFIGLGHPETVTNPTIHTGCYPGAGRSLPIRSNMPSNTSLVTNTSASWNTSLLAWRTRRPPILSYCNHLPCLWRRTGHRSSPAPR